MELKFDSIQEVVDFVKMLSTEHPKATPKVEPKVEKKQEIKKATKPEEKPKVEPKADEKPKAEKAPKAEEVIETPFEKEEIKSEQKADSLIKDKKTLVRFLIPYLRKANVPISSVAIGSEEVINEILEAVSWVSNETEFESAIAEYLENKGE